MNVTITQDTIEDVTQRIGQVIEANNYGRGLKPGPRRLRAAALCDLHVSLAQLFEEMDLSRVPADMLHDLAMATSLAAEKARNSAAFWRAEAERR